LLNSEQTQDKTKQSKCKKECSHNSCTHVERIMISASGFCRRCPDFTRQADERRLGVEWSRQVESTDMPTFIAHIISCCLGAAEARSTDPPRARGVARNVNWKIASLSFPFSFPFVATPSFPSSFLPSLPLTLPFPFPVFLFPLSSLRSRTPKEVL